MHQLRLMPIRFGLAEYVGKLMKMSQRKSPSSESAASNAGHFFLLFTASLSCFPALNLTVLVAGILIRSAVYGL